MRQRHEEIKENEDRVKDDDENSVEFQQDFPLVIQVWLSEEYGLMIRSGSRRYRVQCRACVKRVVTVFDFYKCQRFVY
jgi:hypothetical protein